MRKKFFYVLLPGVFVLALATGCIKTSTSENSERAEQLAAANAGEREAPEATETDTGETTPVEREFVIIAHRGASGYLPEHTLEAKAMAYAMGVDYIEQDIALTSDDIPVVIHDHYLDTVTNVAEVFPDRKREDGRYYVIDFTLEEIKQLDAFERVDLESGEAVFPGRFPPNSAARFEIPTLAEELALIQGLNKSTGRDVGIYPELKAPWFHTQEGKDIGKIVLAVLEEYGYTDKGSKCYVQCFDPAYTRYLREELGTNLKLVQLIADTSWNETPNVDYEELLTPEGLDEIAEYADGVGPWMNQIVGDEGEGEEPTHTDLVELIHERGLEVHPYTFRADSLPSYVESFDELLELFLLDIGVDGIFTDFPDMAVAFVEANTQ
jgi:glycerophosphoryl diester phosphodiesterase